MATAIDSAFIDLSYKGFEALKSGMARIKSIAGEVSNSFDKVASKATGAFASLSGTILATTRAASPQVFDVFTGSLTALAKVVGATLAPVLIDLSTYVAQAIQWWVGMNKGTKDLIVSFAKWGTIITGAIVAFNTLNGVFGSFIANAFKFAAANPLVTALAATVAMLSLAIAKTEELNKKTMENVKEVDRMKSGNVTEADMKKSWVGKDLMNIQDPKERAKAAQDIIDREKARMNEATNRITNKGSFGLGLSRIGQAVGFNTDTSELDKVQQDAGRNIGIATAILNKAKEGKQIEVKATPQQTSPFGNIADLGMQQRAVQIGGIADLWKSIQQSQQEDPSEKWLKALGVKQDTNNELLKGVRDAIERQNQALPVLAGG